MPSGHCRGLHNFQYLDNFPTVRSHRCSRVVCEFWQRPTVPRLQHSQDAERFTILRTGHPSWHAPNCLFICPVSLCFLTGARRSLCGVWLWELTEC